MTTQLKREFDGGPDKPISYAVLITAQKTETGFQGKASWRFKDGSCSAKLVIANGTFALSDFTVNHYSSESLQNAMQENGLKKYQVEYLEQLFRETITE